MSPTLSSAALTDLWVSSDLLHHPRLKTPCCCQSKDSGGNYSDNNDSHTIKRCTFSNIFSQYLDPNCITIFKVKWSSQQWLSFLFFLLFGNLLVLKIKNMHSLHSSTPKSGSTVHFLFLPSLRFHPSSISLVVVWPKAASLGRGHNVLPRKCAESEERSHGMHPKPVPLQGKNTFLLELPFWYTAAPP